MEWIARILGQSGGGTPGPLDDFWYAPVGTTVGGVRVDADGAKKLSAWYRGRDLLATSLAMLPLKLYERLPGDQGAKVAKAHPLYDRLHDAPNDGQDSFEWRRTQMYHLIDYGNAYNAIVAGPRGFADQLVPIHPTLVTVERLSTGRTLYYIKNPKTQQTPPPLTQDEVFHLRGASDDGVAGKGILEFARGSLGTALSTESYASRIFTNGVLNGGVLEVPGTLNDESSVRMAKSFRTSYGEWHLPKVLEQGAKWVQSDMTPEDAQMLLSRKFSVDDIARWLGVPPHMIGSLDRSTYSNIEQQGRDFVTYSLGPWLSLWEFAISRQLILNTQRFYAEFVRDALVIGDLATRWQSYQVAVSTGTYTRNEVRRKENMNSLPGLDEPLDPAHLTGKAPAETPHPPDPPMPHAPDQTAALLARVDAEIAAADVALARAEAIVVASAERLLRKEITAIQKLAVKHAASQAKFDAAVEKFYSEHAGIVADTLRVPVASAAAYCDSQLAQIRRSNWIAALETWGSAHYASGLAALALEGVAA